MLLGALELMLQSQCCGMPACPLLCMCDCPVLGARCQRREAQEIVLTTTSTDGDTTAAIPVTVALAGVGRVVAPESEAILEGSMSVVSYATVRWKQTVPPDVASA